MMSHRFRILLIAILTVTCGCGGNSVVPYEAAASGNWAIYSTGSQPAPVTGGNLDFSGNSATADFYLPGDACFSPGSLRLTGTSDRDGNLTLTSTSVDGQVVTLTGALAETNSSIPSGRFTVKGGCANGETGSFDGELIPSLSGSWTGNATFGLSGNTSFTVPVTLAIQQGSSPTAFWFPVSGTLQLAQNSCSLSSGQLTQNVLVDSSDVYESSTAGYQLWASALMGNGPQVVIAGAIPSSNLNTTQATLTITGGACSGYTASNVTLTRQ